MTFGLISNKDITKFTFSYKVHIYIDFYKALKKIEDTSVRIRINYFSGFSKKIIKYTSD